MPFWVGNSTENRVGDAIRLITPDALTRQTLEDCESTPLPRASSSCMHPTLDLVYVISEDEPGAVTAFAFDGSAQLKTSATAETIAEQPCHISVHPSGQSLYISGYKDGTVACLQLDEYGIFSGQSRVLTHSGSGPHATRQESSHAHFSQVSPCGMYLIVSDLGTDELRAYPIDHRGSVTSTQPRISPFKPGFGPRHFTYKDSTLYVAGELAGDVAYGTWNVEGHLELIEYVEVPRVPETANSPASLSHILVDDDLLFVGVRGDNTVVTFTANPHPEYAQTIPTVSSPRHFIRSADQFIIAGQIPGEIGIHPVAGNALKPLSDRVKLAGASFVLEARFPEHPAHISL